MNFRPLRKFFGLLVLYIVIIFGIFLLQFRSETSIFENFGQMRLSLSGSKSGSESYVLNNQFSVSFKGMRFFSNEKQCISALDNTDSSSDTIPLTLVSWQKESNLGFRLFFNNGTSLAFYVSNNTESASLSIMADFSKAVPNGNSEESNGNKDVQPMLLLIPYTIDNSLETASLTETRLITNSKAGQFALSASGISSKTITVDTNIDTALFEPFTPIQQFTFESVQQLPFAQQNSWNSTKKQLLDILVSNYTQISSTDVTEQETAAYLAEMLFRNNYKAALDIATAKLASSKRTFFSTPYFNNLAATSTGLIQNRTSMHSSIVHEINANSLNVFTIDGLDSYLLTESDDFISFITNVPANSTGDFLPTLEQAAGIISVYTSLCKAENTASKSLIPYIELCLRLITNSYRRTDNDLLFISENEIALTSAETAEIAIPLIEYGQYFSLNQYEAAGYLLLNSSIANPEEFSVKEIAALYPVINKENTFYPHYQIIGKDKGNPLWAWTIAESISVSPLPADMVELKMLFPLEHTHYVIISGIPAFTGIEIYNMRFRTDPRFESYNSSGYVYSNNLLLIKSRHKSELETIRLFYNGN